mmetsp:Transcript_9202/g.16571  ORF Transcript_9202/g.16571 Transcript_9202/m.16571 type:complete len:230 (-) Transcript_9202:1002-1691(-)
MAAFIGSGIGSLRSTSLIHRTLTCPTTTTDSTPILCCSLNSSSSNDDTQSACSRRDILVGALSLSVLVGSPQSSRAVTPPPGLGGKVEMYKSTLKGFSIFRPSGWNEFDSTPDQYDVKWQDIIVPAEQITVLTTPVSKGKVTKDLGELEKVANTLAAKRSSNLVGSTEKETEGTVIYTIELDNGKLHQLVALCVAKSKLYSVTATCPSSRWSKREELLRGVVNSFVPKL